MVEDAREVEGKGCAAGSNKTVNNYYIAAIVRNEIEVPSLLRSLEVKPIAESGNTYADTADQ